MQILLKQGKRYYKRGIINKLQSNASLITK